TAEGGMLTGPAELLEQARRWSLHGMNRDAWKRYGASGSWFYDVVCPGFKYNMTDIQAAIGLHQLRKLPDFHQRRRVIVEQYNAAFRSSDQLEIPTERSEVEHAWHLYVLRLNLDRLRITRDQFISEMRSRNIGCSVHFIPMHLHQYYREKYGYLPDRFPIALREFERIVSLPLSPRMTNEDVRDVIAAVRSIIQANQATDLVRLPNAAIA
ncbi:MAG: DegT/DnrJ/EryC1/StrS family aminotransferase, partial [Candidatus Sulfotelmatobacter sp.]